MATRRSRGSRPTTDAADEPPGRADGVGGTVTFVVAGRRLAAPESTRGVVKASVQIGATRDAGAAPERLVASRGDDVVVLTIANGPTLVLHPDDARDLLQAQSSGPVTARGAVATADGADVEVAVGAQLAWPGLESGASRGVSRGWLGQAVLSAIDVITPFKDPASKLAAAAVTARVDGRVDEGVYALSADALPAALKGQARKHANVPAAADGGPILVLVHGTFVDTVSTFGKLWAQHGDTVRALFARYGDRVYAFDHPTMGKSPIGNALALAQALPDGARVHLLTHSRGGLVAEALARACGGGPVGDADLAPFDGEGYAQHRADLAALAKLAKAKQLKIERVVRVACPARGTLLASKRLDAYLSVLRWCLQLAGVPIAPQLVDFLDEVARRRARPDELPGLESMMPDSPVVRWLNAAGEAIPGALCVIAGDMQGDSIASWAKTLLTDAFYWTDNDIVVQTRSMYGGAPRAGGAAFVLDRGADVSHFNYFANDRTVAAVAAALTSDAPDGFAPIGPLSWAGEDAGGSRGARAAARSRGATDIDPAQRPAVFVLPGILGSNLKLDGKRIWLGLRFVNGLTKLAWDPATASHVEPDGPIGLTYDDLIEHLAATHAVHEFAYDWRRPIEDEARRLADAVDRELDLRRASGQPVRIVAHSMGGLVARTMQLERPSTWQRMMAVDGARLLMLGTPNGGSWAPMQTLSGDDTFGNALVAFGSLFDNGGARRMMAAMPGFLQLQAGLLDPALRLDQAATWDNLAREDIQTLLDRSRWHDEGTQRTIYEWSAPPQSVLDQAVALRRRLDAQLPALGTVAQKMLLVVGHASFTPAGYVMGANGLEYVNVADDGDGRVPLQSALLPGVRTWKLDAEHGKLPDVSGAFDAYVELLTTGQTSRLAVYAPPPPARSGSGAAVVAATVPTVRSRPSRGLGDARPPASESDIWAVPGSVGPALAPSAPRGGGLSLDVCVLNGDLKFVPQPLMLGHYRSARLTGTEWVVDRLVDGNMARSLAAGLYPDLPGSSQVFRNERRSTRNPFEMASPRAAIVIGLGAEGTLRESELADAVRQAVLSYARQLAEAPEGAPEGFELATTLIGSGGTRVSVGAAARRIVDGALMANARLAEAGWPVLRRLTFVELYLDRAGEAWRALALQGDARRDAVRLARQIAFGPGAKRRPLDSSYRSTSYDFVSALTQGGDGGDAGQDMQATITFTLDTKRARTEVHAQRTQASLLRSLVRSASNDANTDRAIRRTLFNLLVPLEMEAFVAGSGELVIELDDGTAGIPWELIDAGGGDDADDAADNAAVPAPAGMNDDRDQPWAIRCRLIRKLKLVDFRGPVADARLDDRALVIGEPLCDPPFPRLPGAQREAEAVARCLETQGLDGKVRALTSQNDAQTIINALYESRYRIVHVAGHGQEGANGGVVLSGANTFLGANEVRAMRTIPELVFLNCCHLGGRDADTVLQRARDYDRVQFAAGIARELIRVGVRCVIAAGWAVDDDEASTFATTFYDALMRRRLRFIDAVYEARRKAWEEGAAHDGNTWAAYQCYGDPDWTWRPHEEPGSTGVAAGSDPFDTIASPVGLTLALENLTTDLRFRTRRVGDDPVGSTRYETSRIADLEARFGGVWGGMGAVAEAFGIAYAETGDADKAIAWFRAALASSDSSASFQAAEQLGNQLARRAWATPDAALARRCVDEAIQILQGVVGVRTTVETLSLLGSAHKRAALVHAQAGDDAAQRRSLDRAIEAYRSAETLARAARAADLFYPAKNAISAELRRAFLDGVPPAIDRQRLNDVRASLVRRNEASPDFWSVAGLIELSMLEALAAGRLAGAMPPMIDGLRALNVRVSSQRMWASVYTEACFSVGAYEQASAAAERQAAVDLQQTLKQLAGA